MSRESHHDTRPIHVASGYERIVYGDHGPYFEFRRDQIMWENFPTEILKSNFAYYDEAYSADRGIKLYLQKKTVADRPNPPAGIWSTRNYRKGGYADYRPGMVYMSAFDEDTNGKKKNDRKNVPSGPKNHAKRRKALMRMMMQDRAKAGIVLSQP